MLKGRHLRRIVLLAPLLFLVAPSVASADGLPNFVVGPIKVKHGYTMSAYGAGCGTKYAGGSISFNLTNAAYSESHGYSGHTKATCHVASNLSSGSLKFSIGKMATINITFHKKGKLKRGPLPAGCTGAKPETQAGVATGTIKVKIAKSFFGSVKLGKAKASASKANYTCKSTKGSKKTIYFSASKGTEAQSFSVFATMPPSGARTVSISQSTNSGTLFQSHTLVLTGGSSLFTATSNLGSATVKGAGKAQGKLKFTAPPSCKGSNRTGTVSGSLTAHFDVIGAQTLTGGPTVYGDLYNGLGNTPCSGH
jgi:hypothetical protein